ncbi:gephyrin-like molybdotransferase Glp [Fimbriiglobus ruber]|uniref:Molybdopterin molybdenumtransferase n=1 Tax=Fimbriiglobus ruber TaxID=1908690 RepID=A0A225E547_9BACT|nr:gephyrin-like molybdotransferase Glp [Fimbriiglobus ruber]OWK46884.1 Molybdopterin biosynthesis protein MoeA [Fimbriiglobus ruber]
MLDVAAALDIVLRFARPLKPEMTPLTPAALGRVLAKDVRADLDSPPFAKSMMDGYAVRTADLPSGAGELVVVEEIAAGAVPTKTVGAGQATALYTGAPVPAGADAVVMKERTEVLGGGRVRVADPAITSGKNIVPRAQEIRAGNVAVPSGTVLSPMALGLLAGVGRVDALTIPPARVGVLATGNELVEAPTVPGPGQIRNSNGPMLTAQASRAGGQPRYLGIGRDDETALRAVIREGLDTTDVLLLAGGVSAGKFDLVPDVLRGLGVETHFHHVRMKPGKPLLFGTRGNTLVFGLPGNPVSALVCFELFVRPALLALAGRPPAPPPSLRLPLTAPLATTNDRPTYHPGKRVESPDGQRVQPLSWFGSADLRALLTADALLALPAGEVKYAAGHVVDVVVL